MQPIRTFVAIELEAHVRQRAAKLVEMLAAAQAKVKWVDPQNLHMTLSFLGDVEMAELPAVCKAVSQATADLPPIEFSLQGVGAFPDLRRPRTIWMGVGQGEAELVELHGRIERKLRPLGYRGDGRRFRPHLTLGRVRDNPAGIDELRELIQTNCDYAGGTMFAHEVAVFSSQLGRTGPAYELVASAELAG